MSLDIEKLRRELEEDAKDPNGYFAKLGKKQVALNLRYDKFEKWLETNEFEPMFKKLLERNGDERDDYCYKNGCEKYGTPLMEFLLEYISNRVEQTENDGIDKDFSGGTWLFKNYWFQVLHGQGSFWKIFDKDLKCLEHI